MDPLRAARRRRAIAFGLALVAAVGGSVLGYRRRDASRREQAPVATDVATERALALEAGRAVREGPHEEPAPLSAAGFRALAEAWGAPDPSPPARRYEPRAIEPPGVEARRRIAPAGVQDGAERGALPAASRHPAGERMRTATRVRHLDPPR